jgi:hypothetical protein
MVQNGECFPLPMLEHNTFEKGYGYLPTPTREDGNARSYQRWTNGTEALTILGVARVSSGLSRTGGPQINPEWEELLMGYPIAWTALEPLETAKFQQWLLLHGIPSHNNEPKPMTIEERNIKLDRLESLLEKYYANPTNKAAVLCEIWKDRLWEISDDTFGDFIQEEFDMTHEQAFIEMKAAATTGIFPADVAAAIDEEFEKL